MVDDREREDFGLTDNVSSFAETGNHWTCKAASIEEVMALLD